MGLLTLEACLSTKGTERDGGGRNRPPEKLGAEEERRWRRRFPGSRFDSLRQDVEDVEAQLLVVSLLPGRACSSGISSTTASSLLAG